MARRDIGRSRRFGLLCVVSGIGYRIGSGRDLANLYTSGTSELHGRGDVSWEIKTLRYLASEVLIFRHRKSSLSSDPFLYYQV